RLLQSSAAQAARDSVLLAADRERERAEGQDDPDRDYSQDDAVLGHRLTLFTGEIELEKVEPVAKRHCRVFLLVVFRSRSGSLSMNESQNEFLEVCYLRMLLTSLSLPLIASASAPRATMMPTVITARTTPYS